MYILFLAASFFFVLQIFKFSTYHAYFAKSLPFLFAYSVAVGFAVYWVKSFHQFWFTQIWGNVLLFWFVWRAQAKRAKNLIELASEAPDQQALAKLSTQSTKAYYWLSVVIYLVVYAVAFIVFLNVLGVPNAPETK